MRALHVAGARPNFMKVAPVLRAMDERGIANILVHTGQHYDAAMSDAFFDDLGLPKPDRHLEVGSGSHAAQTARIMERIEPVLLEEKPDIVMVVGDVNSTLAAAVVCAKIGVPVAHVEAGLRSYDRTMPEEINRLVTDQLSDLLFITSPEAEDNLKREGCAGEIHFVGNPMIDSLHRHLDQARASDVLERIGVQAGGYGVVTMHRPANVDDPSQLRAMLEALRDIAQEVPLVFPVHPRTTKIMTDAGMGDLVHTGTPVVANALNCVDPIGYIDFLRLLADARIVLTDSGGIQEETTILGVQCVTMRDNTERPITCEVGTNHLAGTDPAAIRSTALAILGGDVRAGEAPPLWDGKAGERIADVLLSWHARR